MEIPVEDSDYVLPGPREKNARFDIIAHNYLDHNSLVE